MKKHFRIQIQGRILGWMLFLFLCMTACSERRDCPSVTVPSRAFILSKSDSAFAAFESFKEVKADAKAKGVILCGGPDSNVYFKEFCHSPIDLDPIYRILGYMLKNENVTISIAGNIDRKEAQTVKELSLKRAEFVKAFFVKCGVKETRMTIVDYKDNRPMDDNNTRVGRFYNRRVEFRVLEDDE